MDKKKKNRDEYMTEGEEKWHYILNYAIDKFSFLENEYYFKEPVFEKEHMYTIVSYISQEIAIEIVLEELDGVFVQITKVIQGELPVRGYYSLQGRVVRTYLKNALDEHFCIDDKTIQEIGQFYPEYIIKKGKIKRKKRKHSDEPHQMTPVRYQQMIDDIDANERLLRKYIGSILDAGVNLFDSLTNYEQ